MKEEDRIIELLEEIQAICIGADSPDANTNAENNPADELKKCQQDLNAISTITEELLENIGGNNE